MDRKFVPLVSALALAVVSGVAEYVLSDGTSGWIPLAAGVAGAVAGWLALLAFPSGGKTRAAPVEPAADPPAAPVDPAAAARAAPAAPVVKRTASELMDMFSGGLTSVQAQNLVRPYIGSAIDFCGEVSNVSESSPGRVSVFFWVDEFRLLCAGLDPSCADEGRRLRRGDTVCVSGEIKTIEKLRFFVESCRLKPFDGPVPS